MQFQKLLSVSLDQIKKWSLKNVPIKRKPKHTSKFNFAFKSHSNNFHTGHFVIEIQK